MLRYLAVLMMLCLAPLAGCSDDETTAADAAPADAAEQLDEGASDAAGEAAAPDATEDAVLAEDVSEAADGPAGDVDVPADDAGADVGGD